MTPAEERALIEIEAMVAGLREKTEAYLAEVARDQARWRRAGRRLRQVTVVTIVWATLNVAWLAWRGNGAGAAWAACAAVFAGLFYRAGR